MNRRFLKRTRRGGVKTHVRQTYLREDLPTGCPQLDAPGMEPRLAQEVREEREPNAKRSPLLRPLRLLLSPAEAEG